MNNKSKKELLSNSVIYKKLSTYLIPDISAICFDCLINIRDRPLFKAIDMNDIQLLSYLVSKEIELGKKYKINGFEEKITALMYAARWGKYECIKILANTKEIGMKDAYEWTALMYAVGNGKCECVKILAKTKELGMKDIDEWTALIYAVEGGYVECVKILAKTKELGMKDKYESTALMHSCIEGKIECVKILAKTKELGMKDIYGSTALMYALEKGRNECVKILKNYMKKKTNANK